MKWFTKILLNWLAFICKHACKALQKPSKFGNFAVQDFRNNDGSGTVVLRCPHMLGMYRHTWWAEYPERTLVPSDPSLSNCLVCNHMVYEFDPELIK